MDSFDDAKVTIAKMLVSQQDVTKGEMLDESACISRPRVTKYFDRLIELKWLNRPKRVQNALCYTPTDLGREEFAKLVPSE